MAFSLKQIRDLIQKDQLDSAIQQLLILTKAEPDTHKICIMLSNQYSSLHKQEIKNTLSLDEKRITRNQLVDALLETINTIQKEQHFDEIDKKPSNPILTLPSVSSITYQAWRLDQKMKLVDLLLQCTCLQTEQGRKNIIDELPFDIKARMSRGSNARLDVKNMLDTYCSFKPDISELIQIVEVYEGETIALKDVKTFLNL